MAYDGLLIHYLTNDLNKKIVGSRVDKIHMPEKDELIFSLRAPQNNTKLLISCTSNYPRIHLVKEGKTNPSAPPMFCMLLRKHLNGAKIESINQPYNERIVIINFDSKTELGVQKKEMLIVEIMGKHSNIILVDKSTNEIIDSLKRVTSQMSSVRTILPNIEYILPPNQTKISPFIIKESELKNIVKNSTEPINKTLIGSIQGFSKVSIFEWLKIAAINPSTISNSIKDIEIERLFLTLSNFINRDIEPCIYTSKNGLLHDFSPFKYSYYNDLVCTPYTSIQEIVSDFYRIKDRDDRLKSYSNDLTKLLSTHIKRNKNKIKKLNSELKQAEDKDKYKIYGDLILSYLHQMPNRATEFECINFYDENATKILIPLSIKFGPLENAQRYFKKYNKLKNALSLIETQLELTQNEIKYLENILSHIQTSTEVEVIDEIRNELFEQGYLKKRKNKRNRNQPKSKHLSFISSDGYKILVGRNNLQNDYLTMKLAKKNDIWFHVKNHGGSHVILLNDEIKELDQIPDRTIEEAASLAAFYSQEQKSSKVSVDYTFKKNIKKHPNGKPGMVTFEGYFTLVIDPDNSVKQID